MQIDRRNESGIVKTSKTRDSNNFESGRFNQLFELKTVNKSSMACFYLIFRIWADAHYESYTRPNPLVPNGIP